MRKAAKKSESTSREGSGTAREDYANVWCKYRTKCPGSKWEGCVTCTRQTQGGAEAAGSHPEIRKVRKVTKTGRANEGVHTKKYAASEGGRAQSQGESLTFRCEQQAARRNPDG